jgi:hypothetical protein
MLKYVNKMEQNWFLKIHIFMTVVAFCSDIVKDCNLSLITVKYCHIVLKCLYIFIQNSLKMGSGQN